MEGLNWGEFQASLGAWHVFLRRLPETLVGFIWVQMAMANPVLNSPVLLQINEKGKDIGLSVEEHRNFIRELKGAIRVRLE